MPGFVVRVLPALLLCACTTLPPGRHAGDAELSRYLLEARFSWRQGGRVDTGRLSWAHAPETDDVLIQDPFGSGLAELHRRPEGTRLKLHDGRIVEADDPAALLRREIGMALPVAAFGGWLTGRPAAGVERRELDALGRVVGLDADGWTIRFEYAEDLAEALPSRVVASGTDGLELRLSVERWELPQ